MTTYGLGRLPAPDERDKLHRMTTHLLVGAELPAYRYYSTAPVQDQGDSPMCVGYSWHGWLSAGTVINRHGPAPQAIYHAAQQVDEWDGTDYDGTSVRAGAKVLQSHGYISAYLWAWSIPVISQWLRAGHGPVVLGISWFDSMFTPDRQGVIRIAPTAQVVGGHAILCVGCNDERGMLRLQNSWGAGWGDGGRAWLPYEDAERLFAEDGEACTASELKVP